MIDNRRTIWYYRLCPMSITNEIQCWRHWRLLSFELKKVYKLHHRRPFQSPRRPPQQPTPRRPGLRLHWEPRPQPNSKLFGEKSSLSTYFQLSTFNLQKQYCKNVQLLGVRSPNFIKCSKFWFQGWKIWNDVITEVTGVQVLIEMNIISRVKLWNVPLRCPILIEILIQKLNFEDSRLKTQDFLKTPNVQCRIGT